ncbi:MAG: hypothetical protein NT007_15480 [Candidatus Kapabacteria bacterium]|nr:hypothetical protein [Candidatus Kapabacteria bacterium]
MNKAWIVTIKMGFGHLRAVFPLRHLANQQILIEGSNEFTSKSEVKRWQNIEKFYYFLSKAQQVPFLGKYALNLLHSIQFIPSFHNKRNLEKPNLAVKYVSFLISNYGLGKSIVNRVKTENLPVIHAYFATALAVDKNCPTTPDNYILICDSDLHRVWVAANPAQSKIKYLVPGNHAKNRLMKYGVPEERIFVTGFPLPKDNIGENQSVLKQDLWDRLLRLDPKRKFFALSGDHVNQYLQRILNDDLPITGDGIPTVMLAIGGSGVYSEWTKPVLKSLQNKIRERKLKFIISIGTNEHIFTEVSKYIHELQLEDICDNGIELIFSQDIYTYFEKFNKALRNTDILWTKPSELSFYVALGIPILIMPPVGTHEECNGQWLKKIHAGIEQPGSLEFTNEWLFELIENGNFADIAFNGYLKARKFGTYKIEELLATGKMKIETDVLD